MYTDNINDDKINAQSSSLILIGAADSCISSTNPVFKPQGQHWQPIRDPFELTSPAQHALHRVISFWNFLA